MSELPWTRSSLQSTNSEGQPSPVWCFRRKQCPGRAQDASCFTAKKKWFPGAQTQQQPLRWLSWVSSCHAQLLKCPLPTARALMETKSSGLTLHQCPAAGRKLQVSIFSSSLNTEWGGNHRQAAAKGGFLFPSAPEMMFEWSSQTQTHLQRSANKLNEVCTSNSSPQWDVQLPQQLLRSRTNQNSDTTATVGATWMKTTIDTLLF